MTPLLFTSGALTPECPAGARAISTFDDRLDNELLLVLLVDHQPAYASWGERNSGANSVSEATDRFASAKETTMTALNSAPALDHLVPGLVLAKSHVKCHPLPANAWRVTDVRDRVLGHLKANETPQGTQFVARRFHAASSDFRDVGTFWNAADALECLRHC
ncbi:hypothetical protein FHX49_000126 [Microbacterium endophyticum]|uniref:Uncharacterized protein n=1 Tax=Microbacterium endophyticum TaxID=1526412 RepID=A0A7W4V1I9_9MICO|nr:hypothetical protein [Microbacterium endophyticum]